MPQQSRSKRVAARQAKLGQRRKRLQRGPSGFPVAPVQDANVGVTDGSSVSPAGVEPVTQRPVSFAAQRPPSTRHAEPRPNVYNYAGAELRRIMGLSVGVLAILIVLTFVLR